MFCVWLGHETVWGFHLAALSLRFLWRKASRPVLRKLRQPCGEALVRNGALQPRATCSEFERFQGWSRKRMTRRLAIANGELYLGFHRLACRGSPLQHETFHRRSLGATTQERRRARRGRWRGSFIPRWCCSATWWGVLRWESSKGQWWLGIFSSTRVYCTNG